MAKPKDIPKIAILISAGNEWGRRLIRGVINYANEFGPWHIWAMPQIQNVGDSVPNDWKGDGIIARVHTDSLAKEIQTLGTPTVNVADNKIKGFESPCIRTDDKAGCEMAIRHFTDRGLRNLAFVSPHTGSNSVWYQKTFEYAAQRQSLTCSTFKVKDTPSEPKEALQEWLLSLPKPCGVYVLGNPHARAVVHACFKAGINIPHEVSVLCSDYDELLSHACFPALSGLLPPTEQIGYLAAQTLHKMISGDKVPNDTTYLPPRAVVERLSTETLAVEDPKVVQAVSFIREHAFKSITMNDILHEVPMARRSLERRFQKTFGHSPVDEIRHIRISKARKLLAETDLQMQDVAENCGYATYNYLTNVFKKTTGMTPRDYRSKFKSR